MSDCQHLRIVFAGTPEFAVPPLQALEKSEHSVVAVLTQPDRPAGRGRKLAQSAVKQCALSLALPCLQLASLRDPDAVAQLRELAPDVIVVVAYGQLLPESVLSIPALGCVNIHGSLLPRWRGAAPIHRAILAGDTETGVSIMQMEMGLDTGPVLMSRSLPIGADNTTQDLHDTLSKLGAECLLAVLSDWCEGKITAQVQQHERANYAEKLQKSEATINWADTAEAIDRQIRAFNPWPVADTTLGGQKLRIWQAKLIDTQHKSSAGTVLSCDKAALAVATGDGVIALTKLQLPGKKPIAFTDFVNGNDITGVVLGEGIS